MTISVIIPTFNRPKFLNQAVESILNQSLKVNEIIIVDDNSQKPVSSGNFKTLHQKNIPIIKILYNKKSYGANYSRNRGVRESIGDIVMFLDDDDTWEPLKVENQVKILNYKPEVGLVYSGRKVVMDVNREVVIRQIKPKFKGDLSKIIFSENVIGSTSSVAIRKDIFLKSGGFDDNLPSLQDYDLWLRVCQLTKVGCVSTTDVNYTVFSNLGLQISSQWKRHLSSKKILLEKYSNVDRILLIKLKSKLYFICAQSFKKNNDKRMFYYSFRSFITFPNIKSLVIVPLWLWKKI